MEQLTGRNRSSDYYKHSMKAVPTVVEFIAVCFGKIIVSVITVVIAHSLDADFMRQINFWWYSMNPEYTRRECEFARSFSI